MTDVTDQRTYGVDISNYQAGLTDFGAMARDGFDFAFILATDGTGFRNTHFDRQLRGCRDAGMLTAAYHYIRDASIGDQIRNIKSMVPPDCPVIPDSEHGSGGVQVLRNLVAALRDEGYRVPLTYLPQWYWRDHIGRPDLSGLPPLWISWYPDYNTRSKEAGAAALPPSVWNGYGGLPVAVAQYTSSGRVSGYGAAIDQNVFRGTRAGLDALLGGGSGDTMGELTGRQGEQFQQLYDAASKSYVQNGRDVGEVWATQGRLFPDLDPAVMEEYGTLNPGNLTNAMVSSYSLLFKHMWPLLQAQQQAVEALAQMVIEGNKNRALEIRSGVRAAMEELLTANVRADVRVTLDPHESDGLPVLTGEILAIEGDNAIFADTASETNQDGVRGGAAAPDGVGGPTANDTTGGTGA